MNAIEEHRAHWAQVAKANGWYKEPFYIQVWQTEAGEITDSVSHPDMTGDIVVLDTGWEGEDDDFNAR